MNREPTDAQLLARLEHDREALRALDLRHVGAVTRFLARRCRTPEDLADVRRADVRAKLFLVALSPAQRHPEAVLALDAAGRVVARARP
jgi:hypothetical protein